MVRSNSETGGHDIDDRTGVDGVVVGREEAADAVPAPIAVPAVPVVLPLLLTPAAVVEC